MSTINFLMCKPYHFEVKYVINPWMSSQLHNVNHLNSMQQWQLFFELMQNYANVYLIDPQEDVPDLVFTANAGLVKDNKCILSNFKYPQRQKEKFFYKDWFCSQGYEVVELPNSIFFEGEGDALFHSEGNLLWLGHGKRSDIKAMQHIERLFETSVIPLKLIDEDFYHLDTCFCPLLNGFVMYFPGAFDDKSLKLIEAHVPIEKRILVDRNDARSFACNTVLIPHQESSGILIMNSASLTLQQKLKGQGYQLFMTPMREFIKAGGATKCLVLKI